MPPRPITPSVSNAEAHSNFESSQCSDRSPSNTEISCSHCLGLGHTRKECSNSVRCKICFNYGHVSFRCLAKACYQRRFRPVIPLEDGKSRSLPIYLTEAASLGASAPAPSSPTHPPAVQNHKPPTAMVNWAVDHALMSLAGSCWSTGCPILPSAMRCS